jgi:hypothetical protein
MTVYERVALVREFSDAVWRFLSNHKRKFAKATGKSRAAQTHAEYLGVAMAEEVTRLIHVARRNGLIASDESIPALVDAVIDRVTTGLSQID